METFTINDCECVDILIATPDFGTLPQNAIVSGYFEAGFLDLSNDVHFADEEVFFNALHESE